MSVPTNEGLAQEIGFAYAAVHPEGGRNVYVTGGNCIKCDDTGSDPMRRTGKPCQWARAHATHTINNWGTGHVQRIAIADLEPATRVKVGIVSGGDIVAAYLLPEGKPTEAMNTHHTVFVAANLDAGTLIVTTDRWERIRDALSEQDDVTVQDFTVPTIEP